MITGSINRDKIDRTKLAKGKYLDFVLFENKNGEDEWGNLGFIVQSVSKADREAGVRGPIIGNWKEVGKKGKPASKPDPDLSAEQPDYPF